MKFSLNQVLQLSCPYRQRSCEHKVFEFLTFSFPFQKCSQPRKGRSGRKTWGSIINIIESLLALISCIIIISTLQFQLFLFMLFVYCTCLTVMYEFCKYFLFLFYRIRTKQGNRLRDWQKGCCSLIFFMRKPPLLRVSFITEF